jgi:hypothetical protein
MFLDAPDFVNAPLNSALFRTAQRAWGGLRALHATAGVLMSTLLSGPGWEEPDGRGWRTVFSWHLRLAVPACERGLHFEFEGVCGGAVGRRGGLRARAVADDGAFFFVLARHWLGGGGRERRRG